MVRNLSTEKVRSFRPVRSWRKKTGPGLVHLMMTATARRNGESSTRAVDETRTSKVRLRKREPADSDAGAMSIIGRPDRSSTWERLVISS